MPPTADHHGFSVRVPFLRRLQEALSLFDVYGSQLMGAQQVVHKLLERKLPCSQMGGRCVVKVGRGRKGAFIVYNYCMLCEALNPSRFGRQANLTLIRHINERFLNSLFCRIRGLRKRSPNNRTGHV